MTVAVVTSVYGLHRAFLPRWWDAVRNLDPAPDQIVVGSDRHHDYPFDQVVKGCRWQYPQAFYLNAAIKAADTKWVWVADVDDLPYRDALDGLDEVAADVWQVGYKRSDGHTHIPAHTTAGAYLSSDSNMLVGSSMIRVSAYEQVGGYRDVAFQDWDLWRRLFAAGASFAWSTRPHFSYMLHDSTRSAVELTADRRLEHLAEMDEHAYV